MATKVARKPRAAKSAKSKAKSSTSRGSKTAKSKVSVGKKMSMKSASKTRATSKAKKAIAPKKSVRSRSASAARSKMSEKPTNDARTPSSETMEHSLTAQPKMRISRKKPSEFREEQSIQSQVNSVNPATRR